MNNFTIFLRIINLKTKQIVKFQKLGLYFYKAKKFIVIFAIKYMIETNENL